MSYGEYVIEAATLDEVWRLLCALFPDADHRRRQTSLHPTAAVADRPEAESSRELSIGEFAGSFNDNG